MLEQEKENDFDVVLWLMWAVGVENWVELPQPGQSQLGGFAERSC